MRRLLYVSFAAFVVGAESSCTGLETIGAQETSLLSEHQRRSLEALVCHFSELPRAGGYTSASAIVLRANRLLTVRHVLPETAHGIAFEIDGESVAGVPQIYAEVNGEPVQYHVIMAGQETTTMGEDWAVIEIASKDPLPVADLEHEIKAEFDPHRDVRPGEEVFLVGYPDLGSNARPAGGGRMLPSIVRARVVKPPLFISVPREMICIETSSDTVLSGMSGGAAVIWDPDECRAVVIGIYRGMRQLTGFGRIWGGIHVARRLPDEIFEQGFGVPDPN